MTFLTPYPFPKKRGSEKASGVRAMHAERKRHQRQTNSAVRVPGR
jgi:hypothetical protein